jgi:hypothetical protein
MATQNRALFSGNTLLKYGCHFDNWNQSPNTRMRVAYLDCQEDGLCRHVAIHTENLLRPLQLFYIVCGVFTDSPSYN